MANKLHSVTKQMVEGVRISITSPRSDIEERRREYRAVRKSVKKYGGIITEVDKTFGAIKLTVTFPNPRSQCEWLKEQR